MWTREDIKSYAKHSLSKNYMGPFLICLLLTILNGDFIEEQSTGFENGVRVTFSVLNINIPVNYLYFGWLFVLLILVILIFVINPLLVGKAKYFIKHMNEEVSMKEIFTVFKDPNYINIVKVMLIVDIKTTLWTLCFIIPGIYKGIQYSMIPYLLAENSECFTSDYFEATKRMTYNDIWNIFVLGLSFLGWYLLGSIIIIGSIFVDPYFEATYAQLYQRLLSKLE